MHLRRSIHVLLILPLLLILGAADSSYRESIERWRAHREAGLRSPDGWLTLAGLFWLDPAQEKTIGSGDGNDFALPKGDTPAQVGRLKLTGKTITFTNLGGTAVTADGAAIKQPLTLNADEDHPTVIHAGAVSFYAIVRNERFGIRAKDSNSSVLKHFTGTQFFPISPELRFVHAKLVSDPKKIPILNVLGKRDMEDSPGRVEFTYQGHAYSLRPIYEGKTLFFLYRDPTNHTDTYQLGRMLNTPLPVNGVVDLDFNRAYNPPCTFTPYATCPLAPKENTLTFPVRAGEKRYGQGHAEYTK